MADGGITRDVPVRVPKHGSVSSRHASYQYENVSAETCTLMNVLGYGPHIRQARSHAYKRCDMLRTAKARGKATWITTGSKAEGLTSYLENDIDLIHVRNSVICLEEAVDSSKIPAETNIVRACCHMCYPGHCRLRLERYGTTIPFQLQNALCDDGYGRELFSSNLYVNTWLNVEPTEGAVILESAGPAMPSTHHGGALHVDIVNALHLYCPSILTRWAARPRNWPTNNIVQEVVSLGAFVSPVGFKGSDYEHVEWRMCFNAGENVLVNNLTDTQVKVYVLLKMVKNDVLKSRKKEVTSFTMKNIVLWIAENNPQSLFHERSLFHWLYEGLDALRIAIIERELKYYMIPERNLMAAIDLDYEQQLTWIATIIKMMDEGPKIILRLPKLRNALIAHPEPLRWYSARKTELEMLALIYMDRDLLGMTYETDAIQQAIWRRKMEIVKEVNQRMIMKGGREPNDFNVWSSLLM